MADIQQDLEQVQDLSAPTQPSLFDEFAGSVQSLGQVAEFSDIGTAIADAQQAGNVRQEDEAIRQGIATLLLAPEARMSPVDVFNNPSDLGRFGLQTLGNLAYVVGNVMVPTQAVSSLSNLLKAGAGRVVAPLTAISLAWDLNFGEQTMMMLQAGSDVARGGGVQKGRNTAVLTTLLDAGGVMGSLRAVVGRKLGEEAAAKVSKDRLKEGFAKKFGVAAGTEMPTELAQAMLMKAAVRDAQGLGPYEFTDEEWNEIAHEGLGGLLMGGTMAGIGSLVESGLSRFSGSPAPGATPGTPDPSAVLGGRGVLPLASVEDAQATAQRATAMTGMEYHVAEIDGQPVVATQMGLEQAQRESAERQSLLQDIQSIITGQATITEVQATRQQQREQREQTRAEGETNTAQLQEVQKEAPDEELPQLFGEYEIDAPQQENPAAGMEQPEAPTPPVFQHKRFGTKKSKDSVGFKREWQAQKRLQELSGQGVTGLELVQGPEGDWWVTDTAGPEPSSEDATIGELLGEEQETEIREAVGASEQPVTPEEGVNVAPVNWMYGRPRGRIPTREPDPETQDGQLKNTYDSLVPYATQGAARSGLRSLQDRLPGHELEVVPFRGGWAIRDASSDAYAETKEEGELTTEVVRFLKEAEQLGRQRGKSWESFLFLPGIVLHAPTLMRAGFASTGEWQTTISNMAQGLFHGIRLYGEYLYTQKLDTLSPELQALGKDRAIQHAWSRAVSKDPLIIRGRTREEDIRLSTLLDPNAQGTSWLSSIAAQETMEFIDRMQELLKAKTRSELDDDIVEESELDYFERYKEENGFSDEDVAAAEELQRMIDLDGYDLETKQNEWGEVSTPDGTVISVYLFEELQEAKQREQAAEKRLHSGTTFDPETLDLLRAQQEQRMVGDREQDEVQRMYQFLDERESDKDPQDVLEEPDRNLYKLTDAEYLNTVRRRMRSRGRGRLPDPIIRKNIQKIEDYQPGAFRGFMKHFFGKNKRPGVRASSTLNAVLMGERTSTIRRSTEKAFKYWSKVKRGDIIDFAGPNGELIQVVATADAQVFDVGELTGKDFEAFSQTEGWTPEFLSDYVEDSEQIVYLQYELVGIVTWDSLQPTNRKPGPDSAKKTPVPQSAQIAEETSLADWVQRNKPEGAAATTRGNATIYHNRTFHPWILDAVELFMKAVSAVLKNTDVLILDRAKLNELIEQGVIPAEFGNFRPSSKARYIKNLRVPGSTRSSTTAVIVLNTEAVNTEQRLGSPGTHDALLALAHEVGHVVYDRIRNNIDGDQNATMYKDYEKLIKEGYGGNRGAYTFSEFFADQIAKHLAAMHRAVSPLEKQNTQIPKPVMAVLKAFRNLWRAVRQSIPEKNKDEFSKALRALPESDAVSQLVDSMFSQEILDAVRTDNQDNTGLATVLQPNMLKPMHARIGEELNQRAYFYRDQTGQPFRDRAHANEYGRYLEQFGVMARPVENNGRIELENETYNPATAEDLTFQQGVMQSRGFGMRVANAFMGAVKEGDLIPKLLMTLDARGRRVADSLDTETRKRMHSLLDKFWLRPGVRPSKAGVKSGTWHDNVQLQLAPWLNELKSILAPLSPEQRQAVLEDLTRGSSSVTRTWQDMQHRIQVERDRLQAQLDSYVAGAHVPRRQQNRRNRYLAELQERLDDMDEQIDELGRHQQDRLDFTPADPITRDGQRVRDLLNRFAHWVREEQLDIKTQGDAFELTPTQLLHLAVSDPGTLRPRRGFFPHVWNVVVMQSDAGKQAFFDVMDQYVWPWYMRHTHTNQMGENWEEFRDYIYRRLTSQLTETELNLAENDVLGTIFNHARKRILNIPTSALVEKGLIQTDIESVLTTYFRSGVRGVEYDRLFGGWMENAAAPAPTPNALGGTLANNTQRRIPPKVNGKNIHWSSGAQHEKLKDHLIDTGRIKQAETYMSLVQANLGRVGEQISPRARFWTDTIILAANTIFLPLVWFASIPDLAMMASRATPGSAAADTGYARARQKMQQSWKGMKEAARELKDKGELYQLAQSMGVIMDDSVAHALLDTGDIGVAGAMSPGHAKVLQLTEKFFKLNGMNAWSRFTRIAALHMGIDSISSNIDLLSSEDRATKAEAVARLKEIGVDVPSFRAWLAAGRPTSGAAYEQAAKSLNRFVNLAVARPIASLRPIWMNDPRFRLLGYLKQFLFQFKKVFADRFINYARTASGGKLSPKDMASALGLLMTTIGLAGLGLALRDAVYYAFDDKDPDRDIMDWLTRSGLFGPMTVVMDMLEAPPGRGYNHAFGTIFGPIAGVAAQGITSPIDTTLTHLPFSSINYNLRNMFSS